jgi:hypothetical protein
LGITLQDTLLLLLLRLLRLVVIQVLHQPQLLQLRWLLVAVC